MVTGPRSLVLGTAQWGMPYGIANVAGQPRLPIIEEILRVAYGRARTIDTARAYGSSEELIGSLIGSDRYWEIMTKIGPEIEPGLDISVWVSRCLDESIRSLRRHPVDILLAHRVALLDIADQAVLRELCDAKAAGKIGKIGASAASPAEAWRALELPEVEVIQVATSLLDQRLLRCGYFDAAAQLQKRVFIRSIFLQGAVHIPSERLPDHLQTLTDPLRSIHSWARDHGISPSTAFVAFARTIETADVIVGCESADQLREVLTIWEADVPTEALKALAISIPELSEDVLDPSRWPR